MVGRGLDWVSGLCLGLAFVACSPAMAPGDGAAGEGGESETGGSKATGGRTGVGGSAGASVAGASGRDGETGGVPGDGGNPIGGASGTGPCTPGVSQGGRIGEDGCDIPWWGSSLEGAIGLLTCPGPYDPAMLAYGQTNYPACFEVSGPVAEVKSSEGALECCYHLDERACCDSTYQADFCIPVPYFGDGTRVTVLPSGSVPDPVDACAEPRGEALALTPFQEADRLVGIWLSCGEMPLPFEGNGFVFRGDGSFHAIERGDDGRLVETEGCLQGGLWGVLPETGQLNLHMEDWTQYQHPDFTDGANGRLVFEAHDFVRVAVPVGD